MTPLIVALDVPALDDARALVEAIGDAAGAYKIGLEQYMAHGPAAVRAVEGHDVFLDLKLHDIPTTVARALAALAPLQVAMVNVHALGGRAMLEAAAAAKGGTKLLAVTILTSLDDASLKELGLPPTAEAVPMLSELAQASGCDGVVCAPTDIEAVRKVCRPGFLIVTPGVRPAGAAKDDQARTLSPAQAVRAGADYLVIGRPITRAPDPRAAAEAIAEEIRT
jgi:orotidine-5'-phosphate decarboxylase